MHISKKSNSFLSINSKSKNSIKYFIFVHKESIIKESIAKESIVKERKFF